MSSCGRCPSGPGVAHGALVQVLAGTACIDARVALLESSTLPPGAAGLAQLRLRELVTAARGDRVIVRTTAPQATIAGGVVLDPAPARHGGSETALARLRLLASGDAHSLVRAALQAAAWPLALAQIAPPGLLGSAEATAVLGELVASGEVLQLPGAEPTWLLAAATPSCRRRCARRSSGARPSIRSSPSCPRMPSFRLVPGADALLAASPPTARSSATARTCCCVGARADGRGSHAEEADALLAALAAGGFTPPDLPALRRPRGCPSASSRRSAPRSSEARGSCASAATSPTPASASPRRASSSSRAAPARVDRPGRAARRARRQPAHRAGAAGATRRRRRHTPRGRPPRAAAARRVLTGSRLRKSRKLPAT